MLSGVLALIGGGMVNVNIQLASLKERVREVGVKMALGASGKEIFKSFMTEALLLTLLGAISGYAIGIAFSWTITKSIGIPLALAPKSFIFATALAVGFGFVFALCPASRRGRGCAMSEALVSRKVREGLFQPATVAADRPATSGASSRPRRRR